MASFTMTLNENGTLQSSYKWRRVLLKVSGEALAGDQEQNIDPKVGIERAIRTHYCAFVLSKALKMGCLA